MIKVLILIFLAIAIIKIGINLSSVIYLKITFSLLNNDFDITKRLIHTRRLCVNSGLNCGGYFDRPEYNKKEILFLIKMAIGEYEHKCKETFNPFYWLKIIIFLPQNAIAYVGGNADGLLSKVFNFIYWIAGIVITVSVGIYPEEVRTFLDKLFKL